MKFSCTKENLMRALAATIHLTTKNIQLPILNNILIKATGSQVEFSSTNLEVGSIAVVRARVEKEGSYTLPARTIADVITLNEADHFDFDLKENGDCEVVGGNAKINIKGVSAEEFPIIPQIETGIKIDVGKKELKDALETTVFSVAKNEIRPELAGVLMKITTEKENNLIFAATDSFRLAEKKITCAGVDQEKSIIIPARAVYEIIKVISIETEETTAKVIVGDMQLGVEFGGIKIITRLVEGKYPDYTQIIPTAFKTKAVVLREEIVKHVKAAGLFSTGGVNAVTLTIDDVTQSIEIDSSHAQLGNYKSSCEAKISGEKQSVVINYRYLVDGVAALPSTSQNIEFNLTGSDTPCLVKDAEKNNFVYIIMPIRQ